QHLHSETGLNGGIAVGLLAAALTGGRRAPPHLGVEPDRQRAPAFERIVVGGPVRRLVSRGRGFAHARQLPRWIHKVNPSRALCNKADRRRKALESIVRKKGPFTSSFCMQKSSWQKYI